MSDALVIVWGKLLRGTFWIRFLWLGKPSFCNCSELLGAVQGRLKWLVFSRSVSCIFYLVFHFQLPVLYTTETMHRIGHMCKLNPSKTLAPLSLSP